MRSDVYVPPEVRTTQPLGFTDGFCGAFGIIEGEPMYPASDKRVRIW